MNRGVLTALAVSVAMSVYAGLHGDDELLAAGKESPGAASVRKHGEGRARSTSAGAKTTRGRASEPQALEPQLASALSEGVVRWQGRLSAASESPLHPSTSKTPMAWAGTQPPPPPPQTATQAPVAEPPPPPTAPPFPAQWVGRLNDEPPRAAAPGASSAQPVKRAVLANDAATWVVRAGDVIEGEWRIDSIDERTMQLTYLPLQQQQTIAMK